MLLWIKLHRWKVKYLFRRSNSYFFCFNSTNNLQFSTAPPFPMCIALWEQHTKKSTYFIVCILSGLIILHLITFFFFVFFCLLVCVCLVFGLFYIFYTEIGWAAPYTLYCVLCLVYWKMKLLSALFQDFENASIKIK